MDLQADPLLRQPLRPESVEVRLLGHRGTPPGLDLLRAHPDRALQQRGKDLPSVCGPGRGGPAAIAHAQLEGSWTEVSPT